MPMDSEALRLNETPTSDSDALRRARDYGIDLSLLEENLRLSPRERMRRHDEAVSEIVRLQHRISIYF